MSVLSDKTIRRLLVGGNLGIIPRPEDSKIQPASIDLHLANDFKVYVKGQTIDLDTIRDVKTRPVFSDGQGIWLHPQEFVLARTEERIELPDWIVGRVEGKSSLGRLGLSIHATAGFIDPGFKGTITLEITNDNVIPIILRPGRSICQLSLMKTDTPVTRPYGHPDLKSKYQDQRETTTSRYAG